MKKPRHPYGIDRRRFKNMFGGPPAPPPIVPPPTMPDPMNPAAMEARRKAMVAAGGQAGRSGTTLTTGQPGGTYGASTLGAGS